LPGSDYPIFASATGKDENLRRQGPETGIHAPTDARIEHSNLEAGKGPDRQGRIIEEERRVVDKKARGRGQNET
jgi:hypothetical protein